MHSVMSETSLCNTQLYIQLLIAICTVLRSHMATYYYETLHSPLSTIYFFHLHLVSQFQQFQQAAGLILIQFHVSFYCFIQLFCIYCVYF